MSAITEKVLSAEIVLLRHGGHCVEEQKEHLKVMIEKGVMHRIPKVVFTSLPSKFIYSSDAIKFRASIRNATDGHSIRNLINLFGGQGLKVVILASFLRKMRNFRNDFRHGLALNLIYALSIRTEKTINHGFGQVVATA